MVGLTKPQLSLVRLCVCSHKVRLLSNLVKRNSLRRAVKKTQLFWQKATEVLQKKGQIKVNFTLLTKYSLLILIGHNGLKSCSAHNVPLLKMAHVQVHQTFSHEIELYGINWTHCVYRQ